MATYYYMAAPIYTQPLPSLPPPSNPPVTQGLNVMKTKRLLPTTASSIIHLTLLKMPANVVQIDVLQF